MGAVNSRLTKSGGQLPFDMASWMEGTRYPLWETHHETHTRDHGRPDDLCFGRRIGRRRR
ncbi:hypothetical protein EMIT0P12_11061 [Pseudomonas sp. IT-P12]